MKRLVGPLTRLCRVHPPVDRLRVRRLPVRSRCVRFFGVVLFVIIGLTAATSTQAQVKIQTNKELERVLKLPAPKSIADLRVLQEQAVENVRRVMAATVGVRLGAAQASGVIVSEKGYVLTASHVSGEAGQAVKIIFPSGQVARGETLGANFDVDGSMIRITQPGPWPYVPISKSGIPKPGTWCMAIGHPGGVISTRTPPVRLGRVLQADKYTIKTDCTISGGDSGGPLFNLFGEVIGIHSRIAPALHVNLHVPAQTYLDTWETLTTGKVSRVSPRSRFLAEFDSDQNGTIERTEIKDRFYREVYDKLGTTYGFDSGDPQSLEKLRQTLNLDIAPERTHSPRKPGLNLESSGGRGPQLIEDLRTQGVTVLAGFKAASRKVQKSVVEIQSRGRIVALGTVIDSDGHVLTKASEMPRLRGRIRELKCRLHDGSYTTAKLIREDNQFDIALLKIDPKNVEPIKWQDDKLQTGQWLVSAGRSGNPHCVGVVSVLGRTTEPIPGFMGIGGERGNFGGARVRSLSEGKAAEQAGFRVGDTVSEVNDVRIYNFSGLQQRIKQFNAGDMVKFKLRRDGEDMTLYMRLDRRGDALNATDELNGPVNRRAGGFPIVIQHDSKLKPEKCGGPVVDLAGNVVGINIARAERTASFMIPARRLQSIINKLKAQ